MQLAFQHIGGARSIPGGGMAGPRNWNRLLADIIRPNYSSCIRLCPFISCIELLGSFLILIAGREQWFVTHGAAAFAAMRWLQRC
jgi:hypothetical protein